MPVDQFFDQMPVDQIVFDQTKWNQKQRPQNAQNQDPRYAKQVNICS